MHCIEGKDNSVLPPELIKAYCETEYKSVPGFPLVLRVCEENADLHEFYRQQRCNCAAFITACNPFSQQLSDAENGERQQQLARRLSAQGLAFWPGEGAHPDGNWKPEASYLIAGLTREAASALGREWEQNAIVWCDEKAVPQLVLLR